MISDLIPRETLDAITVGVKREPLEGHGAPIGRRPFACEVPEGEHPSAYYAYGQCEACKVGYAASLVRSPGQWIESRARGVGIGLDFFRSDFDESDPIRVLMERELARRAK